MPPSLARLPLIIWPLALVALTGFAMAFAEARRSSASAESTLSRFLLWCALPALPFTSVYFGLGDGLGAMAEDGVADRVATLVELGFGACLLMPLLLAAALYRADPARQEVTRRAAGAAPATHAAGVLLSLCAFLAVRADVGADVRAKITVWAQTQGRGDLALALAGQARDLVPGERRFAASYASRLVDAANANFAALGTGPDAGPAMVARLTEAARVVAEARERVPRDPWLAFGYANANQYLAMPALAPFVPAPERAEHVAQARKYFALAHQEFPGQPWYLRSWAQLEIDQGNRAGAYAKLTEMEQLDPRNITAYPDWVKYARFGPQAQAEAGAALRRGLGVMPKDSDQAAALLEMQIEMAREAGPFGPAISAALEATATDPERIRPWRQLAELYELSGQHDLALGNTQNAIARFAGRPLVGNDAADYAALQAAMLRLSPASVPAPAAPTTPAGTAPASGAATGAPAASRPAPGTPPVHGPTPQASAPGASPAGN